MEPRPEHDSFFVNETIYWPLRWLEAVNSFFRRYTGTPVIKLDRQKIAALTRVEHVHEAFGSQEMFHKMVEAFFTEFAANPNLSSMAVLGTTEWAKSCFRARRECMDYVFAHPAVLQQKIEKPVVIMGVNRTGSTLLYNLLHQDERTRSPFMYEMYGDWPHLPSATSRAAHYTDYRMGLLKKVLDQSRTVFPEGIIKRDNIHPGTPDMIEEEFVICGHAMNWFTQSVLVGPQFKTLLLNEDKDFVFKYLRIYLQMLQTGYAPALHWTLKSPSHLLHIDSFMRVFPDARVIVLHRDPEATVPSMCYLIEAYFGCYFRHDTWDRRTLGRFVYDSYQTMLQRLQRYRQSHPEKAEQFLDIKYRDLEADPIQQVQRIYQQFGISYDAALNDRLRAYLTQNKKHKHGKPDYSLAKYGLTGEEIRSGFAAYTECYLQ